MVKLLLGTSGSFNINVEVANGVQCEYNIKMSLLDTIELPQNLKFYYKSEEININKFEITKAKAFSEIITYKIDWVWSYQTENGDIYDTINSSIGNLNINIAVTAEYSNEDFKNINKKMDTLPKTGDVRYD